MATGITSQNKGLRLFTSLQMRIRDILGESIQFLQDTFKQSKSVFTAASPFGQLLIVVENLSQLIFYYIEDSITELNINEASRVSSIYSLAALAGHNPSRSIGSTGQVKITRKPAITSEYSKAILNNQFRLRCENNGLIYVLELPQDEVRLAVTGTETVAIFGIRQGQIESQTFTARGVAFDSFQLGYPNNFYIDNFAVSVYVNGEKWTKYESLLDIPRGAKGFLARTGITNGLDIYFGNGSFGMIPNLGATIVVEYLVTDGSAGNVKVDDPRQVYFTFFDTAFSITGEEIKMDDYFTIQTISAPNFGVDPEDPALTRLIAPKASKNFALVNLDNYEVLLQKMQMFSTIKVYLDQDLDANVIDSRMINLFLAPDVTQLFSKGSDYFNLPVSNFKLTDFQKNELLKYLEKSGTKMISSDIKIVDPTITRYVMNVSVIVFDDVSSDIIKSDIADAIGTYFIKLRRNDRVPKSDLISVIESVSGVDSVNVTLLSELTELGIIQNPNLPPLVGLDDFNDIVIALDELPVLRGGWTDSAGNKYSEGLSETSLGALNVQIKSVVQRKNIGLV
jgi:hypothetical protein